MPNKMERFTHQARRVLSLAQAEAEQLQHSYIGTEHLLLGLMREEGGVAARVLRDLGLEQRRVEDLIEEMTRVALDADLAAVGLSPAVKRVLELSVDEVRRMGNQYIDTEHLLLALLRNNDGIAIDILKLLGISPEEVRRQVRRVLQEAPVQSPMQPAQSPAPTTYGSNKMERFTQRARQVMFLAQTAAEEMQHSYIGTEHLLLGFMKEEGGVAARVLRDLGLEQSRIEELVQELTHATTRTSDAALDLLPNTKRVVETATDIARRMGHHYIGTEHLLLGMVRQSDSVAVAILKRVGIDGDAVRRQMRRVLQEKPQPSSSSDLEVDPASIRPPPSQTASLPTQPSDRPLIRNSDPRAFEVLQAAITRILDMVESQKLTSDQGMELLAGLQPYLVPSTGQQTRLVAQTLGLSQLDKHQLRFVIRHAQTQTVVFEINASLLEVTDSLDTFINAVIAKYPGWLWVQNIDGNHLLEIKVEEDLK